MKEINYNNFKERDSIEEKINLNIETLKEQEEPELQKKITPDKQTEEFDKKTIKQKKQGFSKQRELFKGIFFLLFFLIMSGCFFYVYLLKDRLDKLDQEFSQKTLSLHEAVLKNENVLNNLISIQETVSNLIIFQRSVEEINGKNDATFKWIIQTIDELKAKISLMEADIINGNKVKGLIVGSSEKKNSKDAEEKVTESNSIIEPSGINKMSSEPIDRIIDNRITIQLEKYEQKQKIEEQKKRKEKINMMEERNRKVIITMEEIAKGIFELVKKLYMYGEKNLIYFFKALQYQI